MTVDLLLGLQWGDEGKGKIVDVLTSKYDIIARFQGGPNAGHTLEFDGIKHVLRTIPSGIFHKTAVNILKWKKVLFFFPSRLFFGGGCSPATLPHEDHFEQPQSKKK